MILLCPPEKSTQFHYPLDPKKIRSESSLHKDTTYQGSDRQDFYRHGKKQTRSSKKLTLGCLWYALHKNWAAFQLIFSSGASLRPFEGSPTCRASRGPLAHTFNYFVMPCPILRSFSFLSFRNKFSLKITKHALE